MAETSTNIETSRDSDIGAADGSILLVTELQHRVKNLLAVIHALAVRSLSGDSSLEGRGGRSSADWRRWREPISGFSIPRGSERT
jgi:hypothetical protein